MQLVATKVLRYAGRLYTPGEPFQARTRSHARVLKALAMAVDESGTPDAPIFQPEPSPAPPAEPEPLPEDDEAAESPDEAE